MTFADMCGGYDFGKPLSAYDLTAAEMDLIKATARDWQSPGTVGCELATLASTGRVTDELGEDISRTIRNLRAMAIVDPLQASDLPLNIADLKRVADLLGIELDGDL